MATTDTLAAPVVDTRLGRVVGAVLENGVQAFLGLPYAAPPTGDRRFRPPQPASPWAGVREATGYGATCPQNRPWAADRPPPVWVDAAGLPLDEDCLYLNVWTPAADGAGRPVMVWVHTGGFAAGSGSAPLFAGDGMARRGDVVMVSFNHRLGVLGFTALDHLGGAFADSANVGMLDIVAALEWVRDNIEAFGGDPDCVTVFGESGGGLKVSTLLGMPAAKGLIHRAIVQSGARVRHLPSERAQLVTTALLDELGLDPASLRDAPVEALVAAAAKAGKALHARAPGFPHAFTPWIDGAVVPGEPFDREPTALAADVPLLIGYTRTEATYFARMGYGENDPGLTEDQALAYLKPAMGDAAADILASFEGTPFERYIAAFTEYPTGANIRHVAALRAMASHAPTWLYRFDWDRSTMRGAPLAPHMIELPFVFDAVDRCGSMLAVSDETRTLAAQVSSLWCEFARTGRLDNWPAYDVAEPRRMLLNVERRVAPDLAPQPRRTLARALDLLEF